ncbi:glutathione transferase GstA [Pseudoduganella plicata]|uniref:Glutathione S-transferase n=1 Tax=Pseudoduganella plicata TaxID=321984 RepID=A0A4P7BKK8_9BURK|nr:glutathione transferase GstA [Pseudoduganella plicata]QBQ38235.1 glutathione transferase GstA [Pseudoduganella plicata]GGY80448.1 glutathione S-transferase [Pseudoduganella plicata]
MKLYFAPGACSLAPHILLKETGLPHTLVKVNTGKHQTQDGTDFYTINPKGYVPVLELDDGQRLTEGPVIAQYIADHSGREDLMPAAGTIARYRVMEWQGYITSELHKSFSPLFNPALDAAAKAVFVALLRKKFGWVSQQLQDKASLTGDGFTAADAYLFTVAGWGKHVGLDLSDLEPLQAYLERIASRPAVQAALAAET